MSLSLPIPTYNGGISTDILLEEVTAPYRDAMTQSYQVKNSLSLDRPPVRKNQMSARHLDFLFIFHSLEIFAKAVKTKQPAFANGQTLFGRYWQWPVWPDLAKFRHIGTMWKNSGHFEMVNLVFGKSF